MRGWGLTPRLRACLIALDQLHCIPSPNLILTPEAFLPRENKVQNWLVLKMHSGTFNNIHSLASSGPPKPELPELGLRHLFLQPWLSLLNLMVSVRNPADATSHPS